MVTRIELRVHAGAASSRRDDDKYRAQAEAYDDFQREPLKATKLIHHDNTVPSVEDGLATGVEIAAHDKQDDGFIMQQYDATTFVEDTQLAYTALESQLLTSSLVIPDQASSPAIQSDLECSSWPEDLSRGTQQARSTSGTRKASHEDALARQPLPLFERPQPKSKRRAAEVEDIPAAEIARDGTSRQLGSSQNNGPSQSSYLKSPVLDRSHKKPRVDLKAFQGRRQTDSRSPARQSNCDQTRSSEVDSLSGSSHLRSPEINRIGKRPGLEPADYRERTPQPQPTVPYVPLLDGSQIGLAYLGDQTVAQAVRQSQTSVGGNETTSELPTSYSLSDLTSESSRARLRASQRSTSDPGQPGPSHESLQHDAERRSASQPPAVVATHQHRPPGEGAHKPDEAAVARKSTTLDNDKQTAVQPVVFETADEKAPTTATASDTLLASLRNLSTTIRPPDPTAKLDDFTTHVTDHLQWLHDNVEAAYKPVSVSRGLSPLERGYWLLDSTPWNTQLQVDFWRFLEQMIGNGNAGWGVWCTRDPPSANATPSSSVPSLGVVKIFCWGEIVKHVYLMLYVASRSKVRKLGLQWIDSDERVVVQMRSR